MGDNPGHPAGFYAIYLGDDLEVRHRGDWGNRRSHRICTTPNPSSFIDGDLSNGDETNTEDGQSEFYVELVESSEVGVSGTDEAEDDIN